MVWRDGETNSDLTVHFSIGGTATNGVDYAAISDSVTIPAGQRSIPITILPLSDSDSAYRHYDTVILSLSVPTNNSPPPYLLGWPAKAGAVILEENILPILGPTIHRMADDSVHVSLPATNGMNASIQISTDLINWVPICTNAVLKGSAQFIDPDSTANSNLFYRIVPVALCPPTN